VFIEVVVMTPLHVLFVGWLVAADRAMRKQREVELERMRRMRAIDNP
jgi:hypothetical protein